MCYGERDMKRNSHFTHIVWLAILGGALLSTGDAELEVADVGELVKLPPKHINSTDLAELFETKNIHAYILYGGRTDRKANCIRIFEQLGLQEKHYEFVLGPRHITDEEIRKHMNNLTLSRSFNRSKYKMGIGRFLCHLGKFRVLNAFLLSNYSEMILFEDDIAIPKKYKIFEAIEYFRLMLSIPTELYDMQFLGYCFECFRHDKKVTLLHSLGNFTSRQFYYTRVLMPLCNHAVLFKRKAIYAFMNLSIPFKMPGDVSLARTICKTGEY